jgi:hypothetical protein
MLVLCQNSPSTGSVPRCFTGDVNSGPLSEGPCTDGHGSSNTAPAPTNTTSQAVKEAMNLKGHVAPIKPAKTDATKLDSSTTTVKK